MVNFWSAPWSNFERTVLPSFPMARHRRNINFFERRWVAHWRNNAEMGLQTRYTLWRKTTSKELMKDLIWCTSKTAKSNNANKQAGRTNFPIIWNNAKDTLKKFNSTNTKKNQTSHNVTKMWGEKPKMHSYQIWSFYVLPFSRYCAVQS